VSRGKREGTGEGRGLKYTHTYIYETNIYEIYI
jgi:hypothetical protein